MSEKSAADETAALAAWATSQLQLLDPKKLPERGPLRLEPLNGDAGFRRYFRLNSRPSLLAVLAPVETEDSAAFVAIARYLRQQGVAAPEVLAADLEHGWLLLQDFGDRLLSGVLDAGNADALYVDALQCLLQLQRCPARAIAAAQGGGPLLVPCYDRQRLEMEMALFPQWFIPGLLQVELSRSEQDMLDDMFRLLQESALEQPQVWVHRDYHSRNLIYRPGQALGVIDFQDAVIGPVTYDLVSLLRDCYVRWPQARVEQWALAYRQQALAAAVPAANSEGQFLRWFDWMGLQRHIKVLGIFARLWLRDGKAGYLRDLPLVIRYTLEVAEKYPQFTDFVAFFRSRLLPSCQSQPWYTDYRRAGEPDTVLPDGAEL